MAEATHYYEKAVFVEQDAFIDAKFYRDGRVVKAVQYTRAKKVGVWVDDHGRHLDKPVLAWDGGIIDAQELKSQWGNTVKDFEIHDRRSGKK